MTPLTLDSALRTFESRFAASAELTRSGRQLIPGGYSRNSFNFGPHAVFVTRGEGAFIETVDGHRLMDLNNNFTVNVLGHGHPAIDRALVEAIPDGFSFGNPSAAEAQLAEILVDRIHSVEMVQFSCSATESCMSAIRLARAFTGRNKIAKFEGGYHGFSDALQISVHPPHGPVAGPDGAPTAVPDSAGIPRASVNSTIVLTQNDRVGAIRSLRENAQDIACLILELQSGAGGLVVLDQGFVEELRAVTLELGIVLVFDETISLRAGFHGLQGEYGVMPDLTVMGKIIGGGLPLGAVGGRRDIMATLESVGGVAISGTHHGHRLALVAGAACMKELDKAAFESLNHHAARIMRELNEWSTARNSSFAVYGRGFSHMAYGYMTNPGREVRTHRDYWRNVDGDRTQAISLELANRGFFPVHRGEFSLSVPMTDDDIDAFIGTLQEIVVAIES